MRRKNPESKGGFTLLELVVVLAILAIVTALATREIGYVQDQQRFEVSQRGLQEIQEAILGSPDDRLPDGTRTVAGFVSDMGRLPLTLAELWSPPVGGALFGVRQTAEDAEVWIQGGWRGPYVRMPIGATKLKDGWGNDYTNEVVDDVWYVGHLGADGQPGGTDYAQDRSVSNKTDIMYAGLWGQVDVDTNRFPALLGYTIRVCAYGPLVNAAITNTVMAFPFNWEISTARMQTLGLRAIRAYLTDPSGSSTMAVSAVKYVNLQSGQNFVGSLIINRLAP